MEVKNPMVDQALMNTVAQTPAAPNAKAPKDADQPDFDSMVHQKRSAGEKSEAKPERTEKTDAKPAGDEAGAEEKPVADEQYAIAAALMFRAQPDMRVTAMQTETPVEAPVEALPELAAETVRPAETEAATAETAEIPAELVEQAAPEAETAELPQEPERVSEMPAEARREAPAEPKREAAERPEVERSEPQPERAARTTQAEAPREERAVETLRVEQSEEPAEENADEALAAQEAPLFERVEAPVVKVAEASRPIPLEAEDGVEQLGNELGGIVVNDVSANRIEVTLTPENLGKLTVEVTREADGTLNVVLHATSERAANLLEKGMDGLRQALAVNSGREAQIEVRGSEETQEQFLNPNGQNEQNRQQQQQQSRRQSEQRNAQDFLQQLRLGLVDVEDSE